MGYIANGLYGLQERIDEKPEKAFIRYTERLKRDK